jgi:AcrR family transcriptional regulator
MSYIAERRVEEKERRRAEIVDAAEKLYAEKGWDSVTMDQVAKGARLSRALLYVYFRDRDELQFAIGERALGVLRERFVQAVGRHARGLDQVEGIGRAYMAYAHEFPHYFDVCARFQAHAMSADPGSNEGACAVAGDAAISVVVAAIRTGMEDGSIRTDIGDPMLFAVTLWAFTHGVIQLAMAKGADLSRLGIAIPDFSEYALSLLRSVGAPRADG